MANETGLDQAVPSQEPTLEVANNNGQSIRDSLTDCEGTIQRMEDFLQGPRPEKERGGTVEGCPSGILAQLCQIGANNHDRLMDIHRRITRISNTLGVPQ
jgi:hypothetical protein